MMRNQNQKVSEKNKKWPRESVCAGKAENELFSFGYCLYMMHDVGIPTYMYVCT